MSSDICGCPLEFYADGEEREIDEIDAGELGCAVGVRRESY